MEWLQTPPAQPQVACGVRVCWDMEDKDPYPDPCGLKVCIKNKMAIIVSHDTTLLQQLDEVVKMEGNTFE